MQVSGKKQQGRPEAFIEALDEGDLNWLSGIDVMPAHLYPLGPAKEGCRSQYFLGVSEPS